MLAVNGECLGFQAFVLSLNTSQNFIQLSAKINALIFSTFSESENIGECDDSQKPVTEIL